MVALSAEPPVLVDPSSPAQLRIRRIRWWFGVVAVLVVPFSLVLAVVLGVVLWWQYDRIASAQEVKAEVARIQAAGEPITIADMYAYHRVPAGTSDITPLWLAAMSSCNNVETRLGSEAHKDLPLVGAGDWKLLAAGAPGSLLPQSESLLVEYEPAVQLILAAARARGECRYPIAFEKMGIATPNPHYPNLHRIARIMSLRTRVAAARGQYDLAIESIAATRAAARSFEHQVSVDEHGARRGVLYLALCDIRDLLTSTDLSDEQLVRMQKLVQHVQHESGLTIALVGERARGYQSFHTYPLKMANNSATLAEGPMAGGKLTSPGPCLVYLSLMQEFIDASRRPLPQSMLEAEQIMPRLKANAGLTFAGSPRTWALMGSKTVHYGTQMEFIGTAQSNALRGLLLLMIAAKQHQRAHGRDATRLDDLVPEFIPVVPTDPYDGQPLRMRVTANEIVFYSIGMDRTDDGGQDPKERGQPDLVVRLKVQAEDKEH